MGSDYDSYTDDELLDALDALDELVDPRLKPLLKMIVHRLVETAETFNSHQHQVHVSSRDSEYERKGSGVTDAPCQRGGYGCHSSISIGHGSRKKERDE